MVTIMAEKSDGSLVDIGMQTDEGIGALKLSAGFPFSQFDYSTLKYKVLKSKVDEEGLVKEGFKNTIAGKTIDGALMNGVITDPGKKGDFYEVSNELQIRQDKSWVQKRGLVDGETESVYYWLGDFSPIVSFSPLEYQDGNLYAVFYSAVNYDTGLHVLLKSVEYLEYAYADIDHLKRYLSIMRWFANNVSPSIARINNNTIVLRDRIRLVNPYEYHVGSAITLDTNQIIKWKEMTAKNGFDLKFSTDDSAYIGSYKFDKIYPAEGKGTLYSIDFNSPPEEVWAWGINDRYNIFDPAYTTLKGFFYQARVTAELYVNSIGSSRIEITTLETTPVVPYSIVEVDGTSYYCIHASIPFQDHGEYKYIFQEKV